MHVCVYVHVCVSVCASICIREGLRTCTHTCSCMQAVACTHVLTLLKANFRASKIVMCHNEFTILIIMMISYGS